MPFSYNIGSSRFRYYLATRVQRGKDLHEFPLVDILSCSCHLHSQSRGNFSNTEPKVPYKTLDEGAEDDGFTLLIRPHSIQRIVLEVLSFSREADDSVSWIVDGQNELNLSLLN